MRDDTNGQGGGQKGKRGELHVRKSGVHACRQASGYGAAPDSRAPL